MQGVFWNPYDEQISKLSLGNQFDQDLKKKTGETKCQFPYDFYCKEHSLDMFSQGSNCGNFETFD